MLYVIKQTVRNALPAPALALYHRILAGFAAFLYGFPTRKLLTIGVTGTKGKSTVSYLIARVLEQSGYRVGVTSTALFKIGPMERLNATKITMLGRFALQRFLRKMARRKIEAVVVESSSEGLAQWRHAGIHYDVAVMTNLTPEHIESHGSFERYREAKGRLFKALHAERRSRKRIRGKTVPKIAIANTDDPAAAYFLSFPADEVWTFGTKPRPEGVIAKGRRVRGGHVLVERISLAADGSQFLVGGVAFRLTLLGRSNVMNAAAAIAVARSQGVPMQSIAEGLAGVQGIPGRFERIAEGQDFTAIVDYAHEPESFRQLFEAISVIPHKRVIHVFGSTGGGRDKSRRPILGTIAGKNADVVIVTTDDPYDEDPRAISANVIEGAVAAGKKTGRDVFDILDRREAIFEAVRMAMPGDLLLVTGKGSEQRMVLARGKKIPWDDRDVVRSALHAGGRRVEVHPSS